MWALPELIEAASRTGQTRLAACALGRLAEVTSISQTDWGPGLYARCRALFSDGEDAEGWYREAVGRVSRTGFRPELARAHLRSPITSAASRATIGLGPRAAENLMLDRGLHHRRRL